MFNPDIVLSVSIEIISSLFGSVFFFSFVLYGMQRVNKHLLVSNFGFRSLYSTAFIGTPIHELGHALLAVLFRHSVTNVKLFSPDPKTGVLGYVEHSYQNTAYQIIGCFFIGVAPLIFGAFCIYLANDIFFPRINNVFLSVDTSLMEGRASEVMTSIALFKMVSYDSLSSIGLALSDASIIDALWLYFVIAVSVHMGPSTADLRGAMPGIVALSVLIVILAIIFQSTVGDYLPVIREYILTGTKLLLVALYANILFMAGLLIIVGLKRAIMFFKRA